MHGLTDSIMGQNGGRRGWEKRTQGAVITREQGKGRGGTEVRFGGVVFLFLVCFGSFFLLGFL